MGRSDALKRAQAKYRAKTQENITITYPKGTKDKIQQLSMLSGQSMAGYILEAIQQRAERDGMGAIWQGTEGQTETAANTDTAEPGTAGGSHGA